MLIKTLNRLKIPLFALTFVLLFLPFVAYSQTPTSQTVGKTETVAFLIRQNENARELIEKQNTRISDLESELAAEKENSDSISKSYESAKSEITSLKQSNEALSRAVSLNEQTIALLQTDNAKQKEKAKNANKAKWKAYAVAAGVIALKFLLP